MATGWSCPECGLVLAPHVDEHRCAPPEGGVSVRPVVAPYSPSSGSGGGGAEWRPGMVVTTGGGSGAATLWVGGGGGGGNSPGVQDWLSIAPMPPGWGDRAA
jgi:hypothetical protein